MVTKAAGMPIAAQIGGILSFAYILSDWVACWVLIVRKRDGTQKKV
jgi:hypothetical protein